MWERVANSGKLGKGVGILENVGKGWEFWKMWGYDGILGRSCTSFAIYM